jgi:hypothetical protein
VVREQAGQGQNGAGVVADEGDAPPVPVAEDGLLARYLMAVHEPSGLVYCTERLITKETIQIQNFNNYIISAICACIVICFRSINETYRFR